MTKEYMRLNVPVILIIHVHVWGQASLTVSGFASSSSSCESPDEKRGILSHIVIPATVIKLLYLIRKYPKR